MQKKAEYYTCYMCKIYFISYLYNHFYFINIGKIDYPNFQKPKKSFFLFECWHQFWNNDLGKHSFFSRVCLFIINFVWKRIYNVFTTYLFYGAQHDKGCFNKELFEQECTRWNFSPSLLIIDIILKMRSRSDEPCQAGMYS